ncbi:MAG: ABC transporter substrate-binding protein [Dehalococcoidia bacterium]
MRVVYLLAGLIAVLLLAACGDDDDGGNATPTEGGATSAAATQPTEFPLTIADDNGIEFTFDEAPGQIVALAPSFVEVLFAVGAGDSIVAADENTDYPAEAAVIPKLSGYEPSVEAIAAYEPDLVLIFFDPGGLQDSLVNLDIATMYLETPATLDGVYDQIETLGEITGRSDEAAEIVSGMQDDIAAVLAELDDVDAGLSVFHELDPMLFTVGPGSFVDEIYTLLKTTNVAESTGEPYPQMSTEAVIAAAPEVVLLADSDFGESLATVAARPGWDQVPAVLNERVYPVPASLLSGPTPRLVDDIQLLAALLYPEQF